MRMPSVAIGSTISALTTWAKAIGMPSTITSACDMIVASTANKMKVNDA